MTIQKIVVIADGACSGNPGPGGYGLIVKGYDADDALVYEVEDGDSNQATTNNIMEMMAVNRAFDILINLVANETKITDVTLRLDSQYVLNGLFEWRFNWALKGWKGSNKKPVANVEIWQDLSSKMDALIKKGLRFHKEWVKGHNGDPENERADEIAVMHRDAAARNEPAPRIVPTHVVADNTSSKTNAESKVPTAQQMESVNAILAAHQAGVLSAEEVFAKIKNL